MAKIEHQERQGGLVGSPFPKHLFKAVAAEGVAETVQVRTPILPPSMTDPAPGQNLPEIRRDRPYGIVLVSPSACKKVVACMINRVHLHGIPGKVPAN